MNRVALFAAVSACALAPALVAASACADEASCAALAGSNAFPDAGDPNSPESFSCR